MCKSSFQCWNGKWGDTLLQWPLALEALLVSVNGSVSCVKWKESQFSQLLLWVATGSWQKDHLLLWMFSSFFVVHKVMRFSYFETHRKTGVHATVDVFRGSVISGKVGPSLQMGSSLHQQSLLFRPPPFCHLSDNKLILCYRWKEITYFHNLPFHNFCVLQYFKN